MNINKLILNIFNLKFKFFPFVSINPDFEQYSVGIATIFKRLYERLQFTW